MSKMKETNTKNKNNRAMAKSDDASDRMRRDAALRALQGEDFQSVLEAVEKAGAPEITETGVIDKEALEGVPFVIVALDHRDGDFGPYVSVTCKTESGVVVFNDGSTGVMREVQGIKVDIENPKTWIRVMGGLRRSDYDYTDSDGKKKPATTWYLAQHARKAKLPQASANGRGGRGAYA